MSWGFSTMTFQNCWNYFTLCGKLHPNILCSYLLLKLHSFKTKFLVIHGHFFVVVVSSGILPYPLSLQYLTSNAHLMETGYDSLSLPLSSKSIQCHFGVQWNLRSGISLIYTALKASIGVWDIEDSSGQQSSQLKCYSYVSILLLPFKHLTETTNSFKSFFSPRFFRA